MKLTLLFLLLATGCTPAVPPPGEYLPAISIALGVAADSSPAPAPAPPAPKPGDICSNCGGPPGTLGDGRVSVDCPVCVDGYIPAASPTAIELKQPRGSSPAPATVSAPAAAPELTRRPAVIQRPVVRKTRTVRVCLPDGSCEVRTYVTP